MTSMIAVIYQKKKIAIDVNISIVDKLFQTNYKVQTQIYFFDFGAKSEQSKNGCSLYSFSNFSKKL